VCACLEVGDGLELSADKNFEELQPTVNDQGQRLVDSSC